MRKASDVSMFHGDTGSDILHTHSCYAREDLATAARDRALTMERLAVLTHMQRNALAGRTHERKEIRSGCFPNRRPYFCV